MQGDNAQQAEVKKREWDTENTQIPDLSETLTDSTRGPKSNQDQTGHMLPHASSYIEDDLGFSYSLLL